MMDLILIYFILLLFLFSVYFNFSLFFSLFLNLGKECNVMSQGNYKIT